MLPVSIPHVNISGRDVTELYASDKQPPESSAVSEKRIAVSLTVLELQRQKLTGGILPPSCHLGFSYVDP